MTKVMPDSAPTTAQTQQGVKAVGPLKQRAQKKRQERIAAEPPNTMEYLLVLMIAGINDLMGILTIIFTVTVVWEVVLKLIDLATLILLIFWAYLRGINRSGVSSSDGS